MKPPATRSDLLQRLPRDRCVFLRELGRLADTRHLALYLVGGVVRDLLLNRENWDLDLSVEGDGIAFARSVADRYGAGVAVFDRFATARLRLRSGVKLDIASTRRESYAASAALPAVRPASLREDLNRRDFTINAMAIQLNASCFGRLHDPYGGLRDVKAKFLRVLHKESFRDDPTRIFRAVRFVQRFGFRLEPETERLLKTAAASDLISRLSGPRLCNEILLILAERDPHKPIEYLVQLKLLRFLHPRLRYSREVKQVVSVLPQALSWWKTRYPGRTVDHALLYFMALLSDTGPSVIQAIIQRLQLSRTQSCTLRWTGDKIDRLLQRMARAELLKPSEAYHLLRGMPDEAMVLLAAKGMLAGQDASRRLKQRLSRFLKHDYLVTPLLKGEDLKRMGLQAGPRFKRILDRLLVARLDGDVRTKAEERQLVRQMAGRSREAGGWSIKDA